MQRTKRTRISESVVEKTYLILERRNMHTVNQIYERMKRDRQLGGHDEVGAKVAIVKALKNRGLEPFQGNDQPLTEAMRAVILRLSDELGFGSNHIGKFMSIPHYTAGKVLQERENARNRIRYEQLLAERKRDA